MISVTGCPGNDAVFRHIASLVKKQKQGIQNAFLQIGPSLERSAARSMRKAKHGNWYTVYVSKSGRKLKRGRRHRASKKGESPAILSGALLRSLTSSVKYGKYLAFGAGVEYAKYLELGGRSFLMEAINAEERDTRGYFESEIEKELNRLK